MNKILSLHNYLKFSMLHSAHKFRLTQKLAYTSSDLTWDLIVATAHVHIDKFQVLHWNDRTPKFVFRKWGPLCAGPIYFSFFTRFFCLFFLYVFLCTSVCIIWSICQPPYKPQPAASYIPVPCRLLQHSCLLLLNRGRSHKLFLNHCCLSQEGINLMMCKRQIMWVLCFLLQVWTQMFILQ